MGTDLFQKPLPSAPPSRGRGERSRLREAAPFVDRLPMRLRIQMGDTLALSGDLGAVPAHELAGASRRAELATALAPHLMERFPSTPMGGLLPVLAALRDESIPQFRIPTRVARALVEPWGPGPRWAAVADRSVSDLLGLRNIGWLSARHLVTACLDLAVFALLPEENRDTCLGSLLGELPDLLDDRSWMVLSLCQVSQHDRSTSAEVARRLAISRTRVRQLEQTAADRLHDALGDIRFRLVAEVAEDLRARLGDGPWDFREVTTTVNAVTPAAEPPLDERRRELLLWCTGRPDPSSSTSVRSDSGV